MVKNVAKLVINGEEYSISEDYKYIIGSKKKYTVEEFQEDNKGIKNLVTLREGTVVGFFEEKEFDKWLLKKNLHEEYNKHKKSLKKVLETKRTPVEWEKINQHQIKEEKKATTRFKSFLKKHNLEADQHELIQEKIKEDWDPYLPPKLNTLYLYEHWFYGGRVLSLVGGYTYCGMNFPKYYPNLGVFNFNNIASSWQTTCGSTALIYELINFGGLENWIFGPYAPVIFFLNDNVSSAIVY